MRPTRRSTRQEEGDLEVTVIRMGGRPMRINVDEGATVADAIDKAGFTVKPRDTVTVNGDQVTKEDLETQEVEDADRVVITAKMEGGKTK